MCGIIAYVGSKSCAPILLEALRRLEYRGYDSAGVAVHDGSGIRVVRAVGKLAELESALQKNPVQGSVGIGHTRWATHGRPSEANAHPHVAGNIAVVHNGIIENHGALRKKLQSMGVKLASDTDTEILAHLIHQEIQKGRELVEAVRASLKEITGTYAVAVISGADPKRIVVAKHASPLVLGLGEGEMFCGSDIPALLPFTRSMVWLEDNELAILEPHQVHIETLDGKVIERQPKHVDWSPVMAEKSGYKHFMLKEIHEQPRAMEDTLRGRIDRENFVVVGEEFGLSEAQLKTIQRVVFVACGTSHHAAMVGRYWMERFARIPTSVELASEFRGRNPVLSPTDLVIAVTQSGETLDTIAAAKEAKQRGATVLSIANVIGSAITRISDATFFTHAGPEIGVASTKCFTTQMAAMLLFSLHMGRVRATFSNEAAKTLIEAFVHVPQQMRDVIQSTRQLTLNLARRMLDAKDVLFLGRGLHYPLALEGALKLKEVSYIHAEGQAAGEMKHGPIALIDASLPVIVLVPHDETRDKTVANLHEVRAREGQVIAIASENDEEVQKASEAVIEVPRLPVDLYPFLTVIPLQLFAYYVADFRGTDVDQPRNLAKTVTVE